MKNTKSGFTLIELLIVIAIIGILAAVAMPYMEGHMIRARLVEVENAMATLQSAVSAYRQERETIWPDCPTINDVRTSLGVSLGSVTRIFAVSVSPADGMITVEIQNIHPMVDHKTLTLTPVDPGDGSLRWTWGWSADFPIYLTPKTS